MSMEKFDLDEHYKRAREAVTEEQMAELRNEFDSYYHSLTEGDREIFVLRLSQQAHEEVIRANVLIDFAKEVLNAERQAV